MSQSPHVLINGLSIGGGGGYTVARELFRHIALARPAWRMTLALIDQHPLHVGFHDEALPENCNLLWSPAAATKRFQRVLFENGQLVRWTAANEVSSVLQLNGMILPRLRLPTISHNQDPWPYRPEAWFGARDRLLAMLKRREHRRAMRRADVYGWTSHYLERLVCDAHGIQPKRSVVFPNGLPESWIKRADGGFTDWRTRPMELVTVSEVDPYKRQDLVIRAVAELVKKPTMRELRYRIAGGCKKPGYLGELAQLAASLGIRDRVIIEGRVSDARVSEIMSGGRTFVLMSVCESFGIPAIEAMTFGTPVVVADCCAMPEVCGHAALLVRPDNLQDLVAKLERALTDESIANQLRAAGASRIKEFPWSRTAASMAQCFDELHDRVR